MKKIILMISLAFGMAACNSDADTSKSDADSSQHDAQTDAGNNMASDNHMKAMHDAMAGSMQQMKSMQPTGDPDHDYAMMMKHHHQGAIDMAKAEMQGGTDATMKQMAQKMAEDQQQEVAELEKYLDNSKPSGNSEFGKKSMDRMTEMKDMKMESGSLDAMFASMMIPHHEDAIEMSDEYLKEGRNEELKKLARKIRDANKKEKEDLKKWLDDHKTS